MKFTSNGDLIIKTEPDRSHQMIPVNHVEKIYWNLKAGMEWEQASPLFVITREIAAFILTDYYPRGY